MQTAAAPADEESRIAALRSYEILDTEEELSFDNLTSLASLVCDVPIAMMSLVDGDRQWFKSKVGLSANQTPRDLAFCTHAMLETSVMVVPDTMKDKRFRDNPLVTGDPKIRFYAGAPLITPEGHALGTICAIDTKPRALSVKQVSALEMIARQAVDQLELRRVSAQLAAAVKSVDLLRGLLPICTYCKGVRDDAGYWTKLETFMEHHSAVQISHGICPDCMAARHPEVACAGS